MTRIFTLGIAVAMACVAPAHAQVKTPAPAPVAGARQVTVERITVHSPAIEGNLEGESPDRAVLVVLPPSYRANPKRRYPVVYALHGYSIGVEQWVAEIHVPQTIEGAFAKGAREMIVVLPDSKTAHNGSFYSSSVTVGDFETSSRAIWSVMSTRITAPSPTAAAAASLGIRWAATAPRGSG